MYDLIFVTVAWEDYCDKFSTRLQSDVCTWKRVLQPFIWQIILAEEVFPFPAQSDRTGPSCLLKFKNQITTILIQSLAL